MKNTYTISVANYESPHNVPKEERPLEYYLGLRWYHIYDVFPMMIDIEDTREVQLILTLLDHFYELVSFDRVDNHQVMHTRIYDTCTKELVYSLDKNLGE